MSRGGHDIGIYRAAGLTTETGVVRDVSDAFLLQMAEVSAGLIGLFLVGVFFYVETSSRRLDRTPDVVDHYFRASTRIVMVLYAIPIGLSVSLVVMEPIWPRLILVVLSVVLVAANIDTAPRARAVTRITGSTILMITEVLGSVTVVAIVTLPWILGGFHPDRQDLTWVILLSFALGFLSVYAMVMSAFDITRSRPDG